MPSLWVSLGLGLGTVQHCADPPAVLAYICVRSGKLSRDEFHNMVTQVVDGKLDEEDIYDMLVVR